MLTNNQQNHIPILLQDLGLLPYGTQNQFRRYGVYKCPVCKNEYKTIIDTVKRGVSTKCKQCAAKISMQKRANSAASTFAHDSSIVHNNKYDYSKVKYINSRQKVTIICPIHGNFDQIPTNHKKGIGCPKCGNRNLIASEKFIDDSSSIHDKKYTYENSIYLDSKTPLEINCSLHGGFWQTPSVHKTGSGCPLCATHGYRYDIDAILYYLKVVTNNQILYKIGITNRTINERFSISELSMITVLNQWYFSDAKQAHKTEQEILKMYKKYKYSGEPILLNGNTELFIVNVLSEQCAKDLVHKLNSGSVVL